MHAHHIIYSSDPINSNVHHRQTFKMRQLFAYICSILISFGFESFAATTTTNLNHVLFNNPGICMLRDPCNKRNWLKDQPCCRHFAYNNQKNIQKKSFSLCANNNNLPRRRDAPHITLNPQKIKWVWLRNQKVLACILCGAANIDQVFFFMIFCS